MLHIFYYIKKLFHNTLTNKCNVGLASWSSSSVETVAHWGDNLKELIFITGFPATNDVVVAAFSSVLVCLCVCGSLVQFINSDVYIYIYICILYDMLVHAVKQICAILLVPRQTRGTHISYTTAPQQLNSIQPSLHLPASTAYSPTPSLGTVACKRPRWAWNFCRIQWTPATPTYVCCRQCSVKFAIFCPPPPPLPLLTSMVEHWFCS